MTDMRTLLNILEHATMLQESNGSLSRSYAYRSWFFPETKEFIVVPYTSRHAEVVARDPQKFGMDKEPIGRFEYIQDGDAEYMQAAFSHGFVRIASYDRQDAAKGMILEGNDLNTVVRTAKMFWHDLGGSLQNLVLKVRNADGSGQEYPMWGNDAVKAGLMRKEFNNVANLNADDGLDDVTESFTQWFKKGHRTLTGD